MVGSDRDRRSIAEPPNLVSLGIPASSDLPDLQRLRAFVVVAEELNFRRAATRLNMTQSPLSRLIQKLEAELHVQLFVRSRHRVMLTVSGRYLLRGARALLELSAQLSSGVQRAEMCDDEVGRRRADRQRRPGSSDGNGAPVDGRRGIAPL